jgi:hypothetical protein
VALPVRRRSGGQLAGGLMFGIDAWLSVSGVNLGSPASGAAEAKRMTSGTQARAFSRTSTSVM